LNWAGNPSYAYDAIRSTSLENLKMFFQVHEIQWCSLHKGAREDEAVRFGLEEPLRDASDFYDTAVVLKGLDLVISTETAIPNLSAAMGIPTCVLTSPDPDWRWGSWYRGVTVCEQETPGNWFGAVAKGLEAIRNLLVETEV
jgi:ADP-heptose:LPS heptosyltransferase